MIQVAPQNPGSAAVALRAGFTYVKHVLDPDGNRFDWYLRHLSREPAHGADH